MPHNAGVPGNAPHVRPVKEIGSARLLILILFLCHWSLLMGQVSARESSDKVPLASVPKASNHVNVNPRNTHERLVAVVPMIGKGTIDDPKRPAYTPAPPKRGEKILTTGIIAFSYQMADDGKHAIVEFVALDRSAFAPILADQSPDVKSFSKGGQKRDDIEKELKKYKKDLDLDNLGVSIP